MPSRPEIDKKFDDFHVFIGHLIKSRRFLSS